MGKWEGRCDVLVHDQALVQNDQDGFLQNKKNKSQHIKLLAKYLVSKGHNVKQTAGDADLFIVSSAFNNAMHEHTTKVVATEIDIPAMLVHQWTNQMAHVYIKRESNVSRPVLINSI